VWTPTALHAYEQSHRPRSHVRHRPCMLSAGIASRQVETVIEEMKVRTVRSWQSCDALDRRRQGNRSRPSDSPMTRTSPFGLSGQWMRSIVLNTNSSVSPTYGDQKGTAYNGQLRLHLLPSAVRVQPVRQPLTVRAAIGQRPFGGRLEERARTGRGPLPGARSATVIGSGMRCGGLVHG
jgi:hypothetical protein